MLDRQLEPEVMDDRAESQAYDQMNHADVNRAFVQDLLAMGFLQAGPVDCQADDSLVLDLGTGSALIPIELCQNFENCRILASDMAVSMLEIARINVAVATCEHRIQLQQCDAKQLEFFDNLFDGVMSNSLLHHLPEPQLGLAEMLRVCKPGGWLFVRDLLRPESAADAERLVATYASGESLENQQLLRQSLHAALSLDEITAAVRNLELPVSSLQVTSDRHWTLAYRA
jgi:ubiquinone/menaquinone biosynthesis C-methylase UbiE